MIINANQGSGGGNLQPTVTVTPSTSTQPIKPDPPYNGLSEVIVNPAPLEAATVKSSTAAQPAITPTAPNIGFSSITVEPNLLQTKAVTLPTSQPIQPDAGYYGLSGVNVSAPLYSYGTIMPSASSRYLNIPSGNYGLDALTVDAAPLTILDVTPTSSPQSFTPTNPYIGYSRVTVGAASSDKYITTTFNSRDSFITISNTIGLTSLHGFCIYALGEAGVGTGVAYYSYDSRLNNTGAVVYYSASSGYWHCNSQIGTANTPRVDVTSINIFIAMGDVEADGDTFVPNFVNDINYAIIIWGT